MPKGLFRPSSIKLSHAEKTPTREAQLISRMIRGNWYGICTVRVVEGVGDGHNSRDMRKRVARVGNMRKCKEGNNHHEKYAYNLWILSHNGYNLLLLRHHTVE